MTELMASVRGALRPAHWRVAGALPIQTRRHYLHLAGTGRWGNFTHPRTFNEKVNWRILHDRRPMIVAACDKMAMKETARERVPDAVSLRIPRTLWSGTNLVEAPLGTEESWILKPNHSSGVVLRGDEADEASLARCKDWLISAPAQQLGEWGYGAARSLLVMEERIPSPREGLTDYKVFVFDGVPRVVQVNRGRYSKTPSAALYTADGQMMPVRESRWPHPGGDVFPLPPTWSKMMSLAADLGAGWDFIRVDLYSVDDEVWFGEYSPYSGGGIVRYCPSSLDRMMGGWWKLPNNVE